MRQVEQLKETCAPLESSDEQTLQEAGGWVACLDSCTGMMQLPGYFLSVVERNATLQHRRTFTDWP